MAMTAALSPRRFPQSSTGRLEVQKGAGALKVPHDDLEEVFGGCGWDCAYRDHR
jgi:hypothetical protein